MRRPNWNPGSRSHKRVMITGLLVSITLTVIVITNTNTGERKVTDLGSKATRSSGVQQDNGDQKTLKAAENAKKESPARHDARGAAGSEKTTKLAAVSSDDQAKKLERLQTLRAKVFLTPEEKQLRTQLLTNTEFVQGLKMILLSRDLSSETLERQSMALDTLFATNGLSSSGVSNQVLMDIVKDTQVEDKTLSLEVRKNLGGIKAEVLNYLAIENGGQERRAELSALLPGPATRAIFENVLQFQSRNLAESRNDYAKGSRQNR